MKLDIIYEDLLYYLDSKKYTDLWYLLYWNERTKKKGIFVSMHLYAKFFYLVGFGACNIE